MKKLIPLLLLTFVFFSCQDTVSTGEEGYDINKPISYPVTHKDTSVVNTYFGTYVKDPYRWLEDENSAETREWIGKQNGVTYEYLDAIPYRNTIKKRLTKLWNYTRYSAPFRIGDNYFFYKNDGLQNQSVIYKQKGLNGTPEVFLDPNTFSEDGTTALSGVYPSHDDKYLVYGKSKGGSDWVEFSVMDVSTGKHLDDVLKNIKFSGAAWSEDGFFYGKFPKAPQGKELSSQNFYKQIFYHKLGTNQNEDVLVYEDPEHPKRGMYPTTTEDGQYLLLYLSEGATSNSALYYKDLTKKRSEFEPIVDNFDNIYAVVDNIDKDLIVMTNKGAPKKRVVLINPKNPKESKWEEIIPEKEETLQSVSSVGGKLFATYLKDASHKVYVYDLTGKFLYELELPGLGTVRGFGGKRTDDITFFTFTSFLQPPTIYKYDIKQNKSELFRGSELDFDFDSYITTQEFCESKDGTKVPMFITRRKDVKKDGNNPTLLYGYGGFNINILPRFSISNIAFLEQGGIYVSANLRGGGEYGEVWHESGMMFNKQNVFDDFISAAEHLIAQNYTSSEKLAISGRSNGGLLVGATMAQRPDLFKVALPAVGVMDMLRFHKFTIGHAWVVEYGSSERAKKEFQNLYNYSPIHNLKPETAYPATLVTTADHDDRVVPAHSFKFAATLQACHKGDNPVLIRIETDAGHGAGKSTEKRIEEAADIWAFVFRNLKAPYK